MWLWGGGDWQSMHRMHHGIPTMCICLTLGYMCFVILSTGAHYRHFFYVSNIDGKIITMVTTRLT